MMRPTLPRKFTAGGIQWTARWQSGVATGTSPAGYYPEGRQPCIRFRSEAGEERTLEYGPNFPSRSQFSGMTEDELGRLLEAASPINRTD